MSVLILEPDLARRIRLEREATDAAQFDEIWDGVYVIGPYRDIMHQRIVMVFIRALGPIFQGEGRGVALPGWNVSDRDEGWMENVRVPDFVVILDGNPGKNCGTHFFGGPDFIVEILTPNDRAREKISFYAKVGVRELLLIDRDPWSVELYRLKDGELEMAGRVSPGDDQSLASAMLPVAFTLLAGARQPIFRVNATDSDQSWSI